MKRRIAVIEDEATIAASVAARLRAEGFEVETAADGHAGERQGGAELRDRGCCLDEVNDGAKVEKLKIRGNEALDSDTIENAIYTTESGSLPWSEDHELIKSEFVKDLQRVYVLYQRHGYFDAELESYDIQPDGEDGVAITLQVSEGEPARERYLSFLRQPYPIAPIRRGERPPPGQVRHRPDRPRPRPRAGGAGVGRARPRGTGPVWPAEPCRR